MTPAPAYPMPFLATPAALWRKFVLPEIHDLYPSMTPAPEALLGMFPHAAEGRAALSIVPDWQGRDRIAPGTEFVSRVKAMGGLRVLHGWTHSLGPSLPDWLIYGHDNRSEFRSQGKEAATARLTKGIAAFQEAFGETPRWFCAPRWQESRGTLVALEELGFAGCLSRRAIRRFGAAPVAMDTLNFDEGERSLPIALAMRARRRKIARLLVDETPFRLVIHPHDLLHGATRAQLTNCLDALAGAGWEMQSLEETLARAEAA